jgi:hypothetical protein
MQAGTEFRLTQAETLSKGKNCAGPLWSLYYFMHVSLTVPSNSFMTGAAVCQQEKGEIFVTPACNRNSLDGIYFSDTISIREEMQPSTFPGPFLNLKIAAIVPMLWWSGLQSRRKSHRLKGFNPCSFRGLKSFCENSDLDHVAPIWSSHTDSEARNSTRTDWTS